MRVGNVIGLIRRRGSILLWERAVGLEGDDVDDDARSQKLMFAGPREAASSMGERYGKPYRVRALVSKKVSTVFMQIFGVLDGREIQIDLACPFAAEPQVGIVVPNRADLTAYNAGVFARFPPNDNDDGEYKLVSRDRFTFNGHRYIVKAAAIPLQDRNRTFAYRLLLGHDPFSAPYSEG